jgi:hypothetical protein
VFLASPARTPDRGSWSLLQVRGDAFNNKSVLKNPWELPSCGQCSAELFLSDLCLIDRLPAIVIDDCRCPHLKSAGLSGRSLSMMNFIEPSPGGQGTAVICALCEIQEPQSACRYLAVLKG